MLKRLSLGDKDAEAQLRQLYYDTEPQEREEFMLRVLEESNRCAQKLKEVELQKLEEEEARLADEEEAGSEENLRGAGFRGDDEENGAGGIAQ